LVTPNTDLNNRAQPVALGKTPESKLPPIPKTAQDQRGPFRAQLEAESVTSKISEFHLAGLQLGVKEGYLSQENADAIKAKVKAGALKGDGVDILLTAAFKDPEQFKKSFGTSASGNVAAVMRDMEDTISQGLNSHSWSENKYYKPILEELVSIEKSGFKVPEKPKLVGGEPVNSNKSSEIKTPNSTEPKKTTMPASKTPPHSDPATDSTFTSAEKAIGDIGTILIAMGKASPGPDSVTAEKVSITIASIKELKAKSSALSERDLFYLGCYRMSLELSGGLPGKNIGQRNKQFIKDTLETDSKKNTAIEEGRKISSKMEKGLKIYKPEMRLYGEAQKAIGIIESVKNTNPTEQNKTTTPTSKASPHSHPVTDYTFTSAAKAIGDFGTILIAMEKASPWPDSVNDEKVSKIIASIKELNRKRPALSERDLFYLGCYRMSLEFSGGLPGKNIEQRNKQFIEHALETDSKKQKSIEKGREISFDMKRDLEGKIKPGTLLHKQAQKAIDIIEAVHLLK
jgi:hypothetical protein